MMTLAFYDVTGIQEFIFGSAKAREIIGASNMVQEALETWLVEAIKKACPGADTDWRSDRKFQSLGATPPSAEAIYIGGGNALVAFAGDNCQQRAVSVTRCLSRRIFEKTDGLLQVAVAYHDHMTGKSFADDLKELQKKLADKKQALVQAYPLMGLGITAEGATDGLPAEYLDREDSGQAGGPVFLSGPAEEKRKKAKETQHYDHLLPLELNQKYVFPLEFDNLGQKEGESHIGVVFIDGNNMGKTIEKVMSIPGQVRGAQNVDCAAYEESVKRMRRLSERIQNVYETAFRDTLSRLAAALNEKDSEFSKRFNMREDPDHKGKCFLPVRPLIFNGDDVLFVCDGRLALWFTAVMMKHVAKCPVTDVMPDGSEIFLSACAGVAIVKSHFPFRRAHDLAEELCSSAKEVAKSGRTSDQPKGSWIDFQIVYSGVTQKLSVLRQRLYNAPGMEPAIPLRNGCVAYNLLGRPWEVEPAHGEKPDRHSWEALIGALGDMMDKWPRSRLKELRNHMIVSKEETDAYLKECRSRGYTLPVFEQAGVGGASCKAFTNENRTPYFDALELLDFYVEPPAAGREAQHGNH